MFNWLANILGTPAPAKTSREPGRQRSNSIQLGMEELLSRDLPSSHMLGSSLSGLASVRQAATAMNNSALYSQKSSSSSTSTSTSEGRSGHHCGADSTYSATLANESGATGTASYYADGSTLKIQVKGAAASSSLDVLLDGVSIGTLATDASGNGSLTLKNLTSAVNANSVLTVGDLTGTFTQTKYTATLTGDTGLAGNASYNSLKYGLNLYLTGAASKTTLNVLIDGNSVGTLKTNKAGAGVFHLDLSTLDIKSGTVIAITDSNNATILQGTFA